jgi:hypothetical protein
MEIIEAEAKDVTKKPKQTKTEVATIDPPDMPTVAPAPDRAASLVSLVEKLMADPTVSIERATQAFEFYQKLQASQARVAFDDAIAAAKAEIPPIIRNATGHNNKKYADFAAIAKVIDPILGKHGLSYRFRSEQKGGAITVTCRLTHRAGHAEDNSLEAPADTSGNKNSIQAIGSTLTYLQRYTLVLSVGLAAAHDDDGQAGGAKKAKDNAIPGEEVAAKKKEALEELEQSDDQDGWASKWGATVQRFPQKDADEVRAAFGKKFQKRG